MVQSLVFAPLSNTLNVLFTLSDPEMSMSRVFPCLGVSSSTWTHRHSCLQEFTWLVSLTLQA